jgi:hypothetical protein
MINKTNTNTNTNNFIFIFIINQVPEAWPEEVKETLALCWNADPAKRPPFKLLAGTIRLGLGLGLRLGLGLGKRRPGEAPAFQAFGRNHQVLP